jgi:dUTPase
MTLEIPTFRFALKEGLDDQFLPTKAEPKSTGYDVRASLKASPDQPKYEEETTWTFRPGQYFRIPLGFRAIPEEGWWFQLHPRSSSFAKKFMHCLIGTIDEFYADELIFAGQFIPDLNGMGQDLVIKHGDRIGQIIPYRRQDMRVERISNQQYQQFIDNRQSERKGGFGSSGER